MIRHADPVTVPPLPELMRWDTGWPEPKRTPVLLSYPQYGTTTRDVAFEDSLAHFPIGRMERDPIQDLVDITERSTFPEGHFATTDLDENGVVVLKDERGNPTAWMPESVYLAYREIGAGQQAEKFQRDLARQLKAPPPVPKNRKERRAAAKRARSRR